MRRSLRLARREWWRKVAHSSLIVGCLSLAVMIRWNVVYSLPATLGLGFYVFWIGMDLYLEDQRLRGRLRRRG